MDLVTGHAHVLTAPPLAQVTVSGEHDIATARMLTARFRDATDAGCRTLRVDLGDVTFCDVSTIRLLVQVDRSIRGDGGSLQVVAASTSVRRVLRLVGLPGLFDDGGDPAVA